jgi:hypothetical protein
MAQLGALGQWARISHMGDLPASATFPQARDAHKGRICATRFLFVTTICRGLALRRKLIFGQTSITMRPQCKALHRIGLDNTGGGRSLWRSAPLFYFGCLMERIGVAG